MIPKGLDLDWPGPQPKSESDFQPGERAVYEEIRAGLDAALQVCGVVPSMPQMGHTPASYERQLVDALSLHTPRRTQASPQMPPDEMAKHRARVVAEALREPARKGELREVVTVDRSGREIHEFYGVKSWMNRFRGIPQIGTLHEGDYRKGAPELRTRTVL